MKTLQISRGPSVTQHKATGANTIIQHLPSFQGCYSGVPTNPSWLAHFYYIVYSQNKGNMFRECVCYLLKCVFSLWTKSQEGLWAKVVNLPVCIWLKCLINVFQTTSPNGKISQTCKHEDSFSLHYLSFDCSWTHLWFLWQGLLAQGLLRRHWPKTNWWSLKPIQRATQALGYVRPLEAHTGTKRSGQLQGRPGGQGGKLTKIPLESDNQHFYTWIVNSAEWKEWQIDVFIMI